MAYILRKVVRTHPGGGKHPVLYVSIPARLRSAYESEEYAIIYIADPDNGVVLVAPESREEHVRRIASVLSRVSLPAGAGGRPEEDQKEQEEEKAGTEQGQAS